MKECDAESGKEQIGKRNNEKEIEKHEKVKLPERTHSWMQRRNYVVFVVIIVVGVIVFFH